MKNSLRLAAAAIALGTSQGVLASTVSVVGTPTLNIWSSGVWVGAVQLTVDAEGNIAVEEDGQTNFTTSGGDTINVNQVEGNVDPFMNFGIAVTDFGAASSFLFTFTSPIAPTITGMANYTLSLAGSFTNGGAPNPVNGGSIGVSAPNTLGVLEGRVNGTTTIDGTGGAAAFLASPLSSVYGPFSASGTYDCSLVGGCTSFSSRLAFLGSGGGDVFTLSGSFEILPVPVPAAVWLFGSAIGLLGWMRRRAN